MLSELEKLNVTYEISEIPVNVKILNTFFWFLIETFGNIILYTLHSTIYGSRHYTLIDRLDCFTIKTCLLMNFISVNIEGLR